MQAQAHEWLGFDDDIDLPAFDGSIEWLPVTITWQGFEHYWRTGFVLTSPYRIHA